MKLEYADLIGGDAIPIENVGHIRSPLLSELKPTTGIGWSNYMFYLNLLAWNKEQLLQYAKLSSLKGLRAFEDKLAQLEYFDIITLLPMIREVLEKALSFFMLEKLVWNEQKRAFITFYNEEEIGQIDRTNYTDLSKSILQLNYIGVEEETAGKFKTAKQKAQWDKVQQYLKQQSQSSPKPEKPEYNLGNIISKLCCVHNSYNLTNIYNLTVFQLYDQFFQVVYLRAMDINDSIFTTHGGKDYKMDEWLQPINLNKK